MLELAIYFCFMSNNYKQTLNHSHPCMADIGGLIVVIYDGSKHNVCYLVDKLRFTSRGLRCLDAYLSPSRDVWASAPKLWWEHHDKTPYRLSFSDNANTGDLYKYLRKLSNVDCYSAFQLKSTNFFVNQVNDKKTMDK